MWENISRADLAQAKQDLKLRRDEMLRRHAEELSAIDGEQAEIETLERFIVAFIDKFHRTDPWSPQVPEREPIESSATDSDGEQTPEATMPLQVTRSSAGNLNPQHFPTRVGRVSWDVEAMGNS